ncbi:MAG: glycosyl hydrolase 108 family protein [Planctomycetota bacterium]
MADFEIAYGETAIHEGGYVNDPVDPGGETHLGISRVHNPDWDGWPIIDNYKSSYPDDFVTRINNDEELVKLAMALYKVRYWDPFMGDQIRDQHVANKVYDSGVNLGVGTSVKFLQEGLNLLNRNQQNYADITVDGAFGNNTMSALNAFLDLENDRPDYLLKIMNVMQAARYVNIMRADSTQEKFARGWLNRVDLC